MGIKTGTKKAARNLKCLRLRRPLLRFDQRSMQKLISVSATTKKDLDKIVEICFLSGLRLSEAVSLQFADIDFTAKVILLPESASKVRKPRLIPIGDRCIELLHYMQMNYEKPIPYSREAIRYCFTKALEETGIQGTFHTLRTTSHIMMIHYGSVAHSWLAYAFGHRAPYGTKSLIPWPWNTIAHESLRQAQDKIAAMIKP